MTTVTLQALNKSYGKERRRLRKTGRDDADVTWRSRSFHVRATATGKVPLLTVDSNAWRTGSDVIDANRRQVLIPRSAG